MLERTRELGLLRAVGMRRRQLRSTIRWESVIIAAVRHGAGPGRSASLGGWGIVRSLRDEGFEVFEVPIGPFVVAWRSSVRSCGVGASVLPAWRASRMNVLDAIAAE